MRTRGLPALLVYAACGGGGSGPDSPDATASTDAMLPAWGERCANAVDDDGDGLTDEDCAPSVFTGLFAPLVSNDPALAAIETASGRSLAVLQTYHSLSAQGIAKTGPDLAAIFARGHVAHLNVEPSGYTADQYATPTAAPLASDLAAMAAAIAGALADAPAGRILLTFGAESNGNWTDWGCLSAADFVALYRAAHATITSELDARGIDRRRVRWAYGPNATSSASCGSAAGYYPGHAYVDLLGMSSYRPDGMSVDASVVEPMAALFDALAYPSAWRTDRFVVLQTGARAATDRTAWIDDLFAMAVADERVAGVIWFDAADWAAPAEQLAPAFAAAPVADRGLDGVFLPHFWDVPYTHPAFAEIQALRDAGITGGCGTEPARFCPDELLADEDARVMLERAGLSSFPASDEPMPLTRARAAVLIVHAANLRPAAL